MSHSSYDVQIPQTELLVKQISGLLGRFTEVRDRLAVLRCATAMAAANLAEDEVQEYLCDLALELEVAAGRATHDDTAWVTITMRSKGK